MQGIQKYKVLPLLELIDEVLAYYFKRNPGAFLQLNICLLL